MLWVGADPGVEGPRLDSRSEEDLVSCRAVRMLERFAAEGLAVALSMRIRLLAGIRVRFSRSGKPTVALTLVAKHSFARRKVAVDHAFDGLAQKGLPVLWIALRPRPDGLLEVMGKGH